MNTKIPKTRAPRVQPVSNFQRFIPKFTCVCLVTCMRILGIQPSHILKIKIKLHKV